MPASTQTPADSSNAESVSRCVPITTTSGASPSLELQANDNASPKNCLVDAEGTPAEVFNFCKFGASSFDQDNCNSASNLLDLHKRANVTECVPVISSDHVAEIVGKQGAKIKALRQRTNTYIKTPCRGDEPVFIITGRREDVMTAKREIMSAAEQVSLLRARRSLQQVTASNVAVANAAFTNLSDAIAASNLLAQTAGLGLPALHPTGLVNPVAAAAMSNLNAAALMNVSLANPAVLNVAALNATSLQNALLSNLASAPASAQNAQPQMQRSQTCSGSFNIGNRMSSAQPTSESSSSRACSPQNAQTAPSNGVSSISLATLSNSRVLNRLASASGAAFGNPASILSSLNNGLLAGLPSYMPPGFNLATAKHIAQLRVPERIVGLVVGPRGATIKQIQQKTNTYILTPSKGDRDAIFEIIGTAEGCTTAKKDIEEYVLSRTGMTVEQLLAQQAQVRALEVYCQSAGLSVNQVVANALLGNTPANTEMNNFSASQHLFAPGENATAVGRNPLGLLESTNAPSGAANLRSKKQMDCPVAQTGENTTDAAIQNLLSSLMNSNSDQFKTCQPNPTTFNLGLSDNVWSAGERFEKLEDASMCRSVNEFLREDSMTDNMFANLNSLVNSHDDMHTALNGRNHVDVFASGHKNALGSRFGVSTPKHQDSAQLNVIDGNDMDSTNSERRSSVSLKSLLAGLGLDTACFGEPSSSGVASPSTSTTSGLGASLNGLTMSGYQQRMAATGASSESSTGSSPALDMFTSHSMLQNNSSDILHALTAMRI